MATDIIEGLFGLTPQQELMKRQGMFDQAAMQHAQMDPFQRAAAGMFRGGGQLADVGAGMLGMQNPAMVEAQQRQSALAGIDMSNPQSILKRAEMVQDPRMKMRLQMLAQQVAEKQQEISLKRAQELAQLHKAQSESSPIAKLHPKDYTPESWAEYVRTEDTSKLRAITPEGKFSAMARELVDAGYVYGTPEFADEMRKRIAAETTGKAKGSAVTLSVAVGKGDQKYAETRLTDAAEAMTALTKAAESSYKANQALDRFLEASKQGTHGGVQPIISGVQNALASFGYSSESLKSVRQMEQAIGDILGSKMAELGARGLTDKDMEVLRQSLPRVDTDIKSRENVVKILKKINNSVISEWEGQREQELKTYPELSSRLPEPVWYKNYKKTSVNSSHPTDIQEIIDRNKGK